MGNTKTCFNTPPYLLEPEHPITVALIGVGGTGSHVAMGLAAISNACKALGHPGIHLTAYDPDIVETHNVGRQYFSAPDVGTNKSVALISRINRMYGSKWSSFSKKYGEDAKNANIVISCVDSIKSRKEIQLNLKVKSRKKVSEDGYNHQYFWIDAGNAKDSGQIIIGSLKNAEFKLPDFFDRFPTVTDDKEKQPSCSMAEALTFQDLHINKQIALYVNDIIWRMLRSGKVEHAGMYVNHKLYHTSSIPI